jgi:nitroreductase
MRVDEAIRARRAIKWYDPEHQMPEETFLKLFEHAILAPTVMWSRKKDTKLSNIQFKPFFYIKKALAKIPYFVISFMPDRGIRQCWEAT